MPKRKPNTKNSEPSNKKIIKRHHGYRKRFRYGNDSG